MLWMLFQIEIPKGRTNLGQRTICAGTLPRNSTQAGRCLTVIKFVKNYNGPLYIVRTYHFKNKCG